MLLKKLEVYGFKSFADRTVFDFETGLTAVVGPNGCGKSNVVDAVKWVLGEQSAKSLRGSEMADVIFNGSESRKSLGFAEVSLTVSNEDRRLPVDYEDVRITRRLYRSGESEYLINNDVARLRDIREMFMDTGIGMDAYSLIEQGKVEALISSNPQGRRAIFEEAAGISKFKAQKKRAVAKLERVRHNLERLDDIIEEVERQLRSIKRQASKARRYKNVADELSNVRVELALHRYHEMKLKLQDARKRIEAAEDERQMISTRTETLDAERSELDADAVELDKSITRIQNADIQLQGRFRTAENAIKFNRERIGELEQQESKLTNEVTAIRKRLALVKHDLVTSIDEAEQIDEDAAGNDKRLEEVRNQLSELSQTCADLNRDVEEQRSTALELMRLMSRHQNDLTQLGAERRGMESRNSRLQTRKEEISRELAQLADRREAVQAELERAQTERTETQEEVQECIEQRDELNGRVHELSDRLAALREELTSLQSRREVLEDLEEKQEGLGAGSRYVIEQAGGENAQMQGILGLVADLVETDMSHAVAVEAALGDAAQSVVARSFRDAVDAVEHLRESGEGRASFLSVDRLKRPEREMPAAGEHPGLLGRARDFVQCDGETGRLFDSLLGETLVVESFDQAVAHADNGLGSWRFVTLGGETIEPGGAVTGGNTAGRTGLITRKAELREVIGRIDELKTETEELDRELQENSHLRDEVEHRIDELRDRAGELAIVITQKSHEIERLDADTQRLSQEQEIGDSEIAEIERQLETITSKEEKLRADVERIRADEQAIEKKVEQLEAEREEAERRRGSLDEAATELKVKIAQQKERRQSLVAAAGRMRQSIGDYKIEMLAALDEIEMSRKRRVEAVEAISDKEEELAGISSEREDLGEQLQEATSKREEARSALEANTKRLREARSGLEETDKNLQELRLTEHDTRTHIENLAERTSDLDDVDLSVMLPHYEPPEDVDWNAKAEEVESLQKRLKKMGNVNLNAIDEQEELEQRSSFLGSQREDLEKSRKQLMEVIRKINRQSREMFKDTFDTVRENFQKTFRKLFAGGKADIVLEEDEDILEAGVDIIARPPGKEQQSISLLSGGEKSLTAVALLFAIFQSKPSPFCILDEVDAALDEDNTDRFVSMLRGYLSDSQFIVVTHSRRTMGMADVMYGITMQESGVSKKVSVKLAELEEKVA